MKNMNDTKKDLFRIKFQSRSDMVVDKITNSIINGELSDGELLPPENQLCEIFGISRSILREAIRVLASKGLVEVRQGHGTSVRLPKIDIPQQAVRDYLMTNAYSLLQLVEVRTPLEVKAASLAAKRREEKHLQLMEESFQTMHTALMGADELSDADEAFHKAIIDASGNPLFGIMIRSIMGNLHISRQLAIRHFGIEVVIGEHQKIFKAIKKRQPASAANAMQTHMDGALKRINQVNELLGGQKQMSLNTV